ncbi:MAG: HAF repeat-containing protein, partial [Planctomycetes bacterium]|nr:HAF repeat-containing protein [Planctomycetota bacterium]
MVDLAIPFGFSDARASDINDFGQIVGELEKGNLAHAALWQAGEVIELGTLPGGNFSQAWAINNSGQIVGLAGNSATGPLRPFLWQDGVMSDIELPLGPWGEANDINETGAIVGWMGSSLFEGHAFVLHEGTVTDLGFMLGGLSGNAKAINNNGQIVGEGLVELNDGSMAMQSFLWKDGEM